MGKIMENNEFSEMLEILEKGSQLNVGLYPELKVVRYGYHYLDKRITLFLQAEQNDINFIKDFIKLNVKINFNKWSSNGNYIIGDGYCKILEDDNQKLDGLSYIIKQHNKNNLDYDIDVKSLDEILIIEFYIENINLIKKK